MSKLYSTMTTTIETLTSMLSSLFSLRVSDDARNSLLREIYALLNFENRVVKGCPSLEDEVIVRGERVHRILSASTSSETRVKCCHQLREALISLSSSDVGFEETLNSILSV